MMVVVVSPEGWSHGLGSVFYPRRDHVLSTVTKAYAIKFENTAISLAPGSSNGTDLIYSLVG